MNSSTEDRLPVGRIGKPFGVRGEVTFVAASPGSSQFAPGARFLTDSGVELVVRSARPYRDRGFIIGFAGVGRRDMAEQLRGAVLTIDASERPDLDSDEYWTDDLVGLQAVDPAGEVLGTVVSVDFGTAQDRLVVRTAGGQDVLVPFVGDIVGDPIDGRIVIDAPAGLFG